VPFKTTTGMAASTSEEKMKMWIVTGSSESGDNYGPLAFSKNPSKKMLSTIAFCWDGNPEEKQGPGFDGSYVYLKVYGVIVDSGKPHFSFASGGK
jgi:hypothetical protein